MSHNLLKHPYRPADASSETSLSVNNSGCVKCATNKVGKYSCCARGGAWFKNCGDVGDTKFDHTWTEGIEACKSLITVVSVESPVEDILRHVGTMVYPLNSAHTQNTNYQQTDKYRVGIVSNVGPTDCQDYVRLVKVVVCVCFYVSFYTCRYIRIVSFLYIFIDSDK